MTRFGPLPVGTGARLWEQLAARSVMVDPQRLLPHHSPPGQATATCRVTTVWCRNGAGRVEAMARRTAKAAPGYAALTRRYPARRPRRTDGSGSGSGPLR